MIQKTKYLTLFLLALMSLSMGVHKYYVAVFQLNYVPAKKEVQMTSRIFIDDLEAAFVKKYKKKFYLGAANEAADANEYLKKYFAEKIHIKVNGKEKQLKFLGRETEEDILICYFTLPAESAVNTINVSNTTLLDIYNDQQNIVHASVKGNKKSLLLTNDTTTGVLEF